MMFTVAWYHPDLAGSMIVDAHCETCSVKALLTHLSRELKLPETEVAGKATVVALFAGHQSNILCNVPIYKQDMIDAEHSEKPSINFVPKDQKEN